MIYCTLGHNHEFSLHINSANTNTHNKTCPLQKFKTFWHLSFFFFNGFWFSSQKLVNIQRALCSRLKSPTSKALARYSPLLVHRCMYAACMSVGVAPRSNFVCCDCLHWVFFFFEIDIWSESNRPAGELRNNPFYQPGHLMPHLKRWLPRQGRRVSASAMVCDWLACLTGTYHVVSL